MTEAPRPRSAAALALLACLAAALFAGLIALGTWQVHRRAWKLDLIARVDARVHAAPVPAPGPAEWPGITRKRDAYRRVRVTGTFLNNDETLVTATTALGGGYWVLTPLRTARGFVVLVNRGFVPPEKQDAADRAVGQIAGPAIVTGLLRMTEPGGGFLRANRSSANRWYSRDVSAIAAARGLANVAPYFIDADAAANPGGFPVGGLTVIAFPDNHLVYAITWYVLALMVAGAAAYTAREEWRLRRRAV